MKAFSSLAAVVALWLGVSFSLWFVYRLFRRRDGSRQKQLSAARLGLVDEGAAVFSALRARASQSVNASGAYAWHSGDATEALQDDVRALLNAIEAKSSYFDRVKAAKKKIEKAFGLSGFRAACRNSANPPRLLGCLGDFSDRRHPGARGGAYGTRVL